MDKSIAFSVFKHTMLISFLEQDFVNIRYKVLI